MTINSKETVSETAKIFTISSGISVVKVSGTAGLNGEFLANKENKRAWDNKNCVRRMNLKKTKKI